MYNIKTRLQCGVVHSRNNRALATYSVFSGKQFIDILYPIFNHRILSEYKFEQFKKVCDIYGLSAQRGQHSNFAWLAGFIDGDGSFYVSISPRQISARFSLGQKLREILDIINNNFFGNAGKVNGGDNIGQKKATYYILCFYCNKTAFVDSFMKFPLATKKRIAFARWYKIVQMIQNKEHLTLEGRLKIEKIGKNINKNMIESDPLGD